MHEPAPQPQSRRALRELERARVPRRRKRAIAHRRAEAAQQAAEARNEAPSAWVTAALPAIPAPQPAAPQQAAPARASVTEPRRSKSSKPLTVAAFVFAIGLAVTSIVPMLALGQSATAAAATAAGVQAPDKVQAWKSSMVAELPQLSRDDYSAGVAKPSAIWNSTRHANTFTNNVNWAIQWPFPFGVPISYGFGPRVAPTEGASTFHEGVDFDPGAGSPIQVITKGVVEKVNNNAGAGLGVYVVVDHGMIDGHHIESYYCEMAPGSIQVAVGQQVDVGDIVGKVGVSGISTGAHLHFELHVDGTPVDPEAWLKANAG